MYHAWLPLRERQKRGVTSAPPTLSLSRPPLPQWRLEGTPKVSDGMALFDIDLFGEINLSNFLGKLPPVLEDITVSIKSFHYLVGQLSTSSLTSFCFVLFSPLVA